MPLPSALHSIFALVLAWVALGAAGLLFPRNLTWVSRVMFPLGAAVAAAILRRAPGACLRPGCAPGGLLLRCAHLRTDDEARP